MRVPLIAFLIFFTLAASAQHPVRDAVNYALLTGGQKLYSSHIRLKCTDTATQYLELDNHRQIPLDQISRFQSRDGIFVTVPGSAGTDIYKVEREGTKISLYSRMIVDPLHAGDSGYTPTNVFYFRRPGQQKMQLTTYHGLLNAMKDNPASIHQLHLARTNFILGWGISLASAVIMGVGLHETFRNNAGNQPKPPVNNGQLQPGPLPPGHPLSPLVYIGAGGMIGGLVLAFRSPHYQFKAFDIYNK